MRARILFLCFALILSFVAGFGTVEAACPTSCAEAEQECLSGCPCAYFKCNPKDCSSICSCPIICLD